MRSILVLSWWLSLFASMQGAALALDGFHHLEWGRLGAHLLKAFYVAFAAVLFMRYRSFRTQKRFETMLESYSRVSGNAIGDEAFVKGAWINPAILLMLLTLAIADSALIFRWNEAVFGTTVCLDFLIWMLTLRWLGRSYWLKAKGKRERLKEVLDDSRSRMSAGHAPEPGILEKKVSKTPFLALTLSAMLLALGISAMRWRRVESVYRIDDLKACMERCLVRAEARFHEQGQWGMGVPEEPCALDNRGRLDFSLDLRVGELHLSAFERDSSDFFGNGLKGDEGLNLDVAGHFRRVGSGKSALDP